MGGRGVVGILEVAFVVVERSSGGGRVAEGTMADI